MRLYLDIDGVILGKGGKLPEHLEEFLTWVTANFEVYWLTTHCKGDARTALRYLSSYYPPHLLALVECI